MDEDLKENITAKQTWLRGLYILLFAFLLAVARAVVWAVVVLQFLFTLFSGKTNDNLLAFGSSLSRYIYQCLLFVTFKSDQKPFPFDGWPLPEGAEAEEPRPAKKKASPKKSRAKQAVKKQSPAKRPTSTTEAPAQPEEPGATSENRPVAESPDDERPVLEQDANEGSDKPGG